MKEDLEQALTDLDQVLDQQKLDAQRIERQLHPIPGTRYTSH